MLKPEPSSRWSRLWNQITPLLTLNDNKRPWGKLLVSALAVGIPAFIGAWLDHLVTTMLASMGGMVILYMRPTRIARRMMTLVVCSFGFAVCFSVGLLTSFDPYLSTISLALTVFLITLICRFFSVPPPGSFFFILVAILGRTLPFDLTQIAERTGILLFGCMGACLLALGYSVAQQLFFKERTVGPVEPEDHRIAAIILEAAVIGIAMCNEFLAPSLVWGWPGRYFLCRRASGNWRR